MTVMNKNTPKFTMKHTPSPWSFIMQEEYGKPQFTAVINGDNSRLADVKFAFLMHPAECHANAKLIAAAPELLESLKQISALLTRYVASPDSRLTMDQVSQVNKRSAEAWAAIRKAEGQ